MRSEFSFIHRDSIPLCWCYNVGKWDGSTLIDGASRSVGIAFRFIGIAFRFIGIVFRFIGIAFRPTFWNPCPARLSEGKISLYLSSTIFLPARERGKRIKQSGFMRDCQVGKILALI